MTSELTKSITTPANNSDSAPSASKGKHHEPGDRDSEGEDVDNEDGSDSESESEIGEEVPSGMENDFGSTDSEPPEDDEFNVDDEIDINSPVLRKIIGQDSSLSLATATASKPTASHQPNSTNTSFEMNDKDFNKLWES